MRRHLGHCFAAFVRRCLLWRICFCRWNVFLQCGQMYWKPRLRTLMVVRLFGTCGFAEDFLNVFGMFICILFRLTACDFCVKIVDVSYFLFNGFPCVVALVIVLVWVVTCIVGPFTFSFVFAMLVSFSTLSVMCGVTLLRGFVMFCTCSFS